MQLNEEYLEGSIIGTVLTWHSELEIASCILDPEDFYHQEARDTFRYIIANEKSTVGVISAATGVKPEVLSEWVERCPSNSSGLRQECEALKEAANKRRLWDNLAKIREQFHTSSLAVLQEQIEQCGARFAVSPSDGAVRVGAKLSETLNRMEERRRNPGAIFGIPYGYPALDSKTGGMHKGDLIIIAGRPSMGKSAFMANILENGALLNHHGLLFSLEMNHDQLVERFLASISRVKYHHIRGGNFADADYVRLTKGCDAIYRYPLWIDDTPNISLRDIKARARKQKKQGLDFVAVDYLQLMTVVGKNRVQEIGEISRGLKLLARELDIAIIALSQLSRGVDGRQDKRPVMSDLRDSGEIEQDADVILFPFRPAAYCDKCRDKLTTPDHDPIAHGQIAEVIIEKQRNGERNLSIPLTWRGEFQRFEPNEERI